MKPRYLTALRLLALHNATSDSPSPDYMLRRVFRWYSKTFHTPLHEVENLPLHDVLVHYHEANYEELEEQELEVERDLLVMTAEERKAEKLRQDARKVEDYLFEKEATEEEVLTFKKPRGPKKGSLGALKKLPDRDKTVFDAIKKAEEVVKETGMLMAQASQEDINLVFADDGEFSDLADMDGLGNDPLVGED